jgi:drug/metabolite transporter (DMT)-like permease
MNVLSPLRRGLIYFCLYIVLLVATLALTKSLMQHYGFGEVVFLRLFPAWVAIVLYTFFKSGFHPWKSKRWKAHVLRGFVGFVNLITLYLSVKLLPLSLAVTLKQLEAFLWVALAAFLYREKVSARQWLALVIGFTGVILVLRPAAEANALGAIVALIGAATGAFIRVLSRELSRTEKSTTILFFNFSQWTVLSFLIEPWAWTMPGAEDWAAFLLTSAIVLVSQWLMTEGMALVPAPRLAPFRHTEIFWGGLVGWLVWHEPISAWFVAGSTLIIVGGVTANWRERRVKALPGAL